MYQLFSIKKNSSRETLRVNCNECCLCTAPIMQRERQQYQMQAPVMLQPQCREIVPLYREMNSSQFFCQSHISALLTPTDSALTWRQGVTVVYFGCNQFFLVCAFYSHGGSLMKFHPKECDVGSGYRFMLEGQVKKCLLITCLYWYRRDIP